MSPQEIYEALREPFDPSALGWKPQVLGKDGTSALAVGYIDARDVQDRLNDVLGIDGWEDEYVMLADGNVLCNLKVRIGDRWVVKSDVGDPSDQKEAGNRLKSAVSDALKRAAVKIGVGRYIYNLPQVWCDYDGRKKEFTRTPNLPAWALPKGYKGAAKPERVPPQGGSGTAPPQSVPPAEPPVDYEAKSKHLLAKLPLTTTIESHDAVVVELRKVYPNTSDAVKETIKAEIAANKKRLTPEPAVPVSKPPF